MKKQLRGDLARQIAKDVHRDARQRARDRLLQEEADREVEAQQHAAEEHRARIEVRNVIAQCNFIPNIYVRRNVRRKDYELQLWPRLRIALLDDNDAHLANFETWCRQAPHTF